MKLTVTLATIFVWIMIALGVVFLILNPAPISSPQTQTTYGLPGEQEVGYYYLDPASIVVEYNPTNRNIFIQKGDDTVNIPLIKEQVEALGIENWFTLEDDGELLTVQPPCKYLQLTIEKKPFSSITDITRDVACKQVLDHEHTESTLYQE